MKFRPIKRLATDYYFSFMICIQQIEAKVQTSYEQRSMKNLVHFAQCTKKANKNTSGEYFVKSIQHVWSAISSFST